jgi:hypothetical protein
MGCQNSDSGSKPKDPPKPSQMNGGVDSGGGNAIRSQPEEVQKIFDGQNGFNLKKATGAIFKILDLQSRNALLTPNLKKMVNTMLAKSSADSSIYEDINSSSYNLIQKGPCIDGYGEQKDAGTKIGSLKAEICFSMERLTQIPLQAIPAQLIALAIHEHSHHYGFSEVDAVELQNHVLSIMMNKIDIERFMSLAMSMENINGESKLLGVRLNKKEVPDYKICYQIGILEESIKEFVTMHVNYENDIETNLLSQALKQKLHLKFVPKDLLKKLSFASMDLGYYCSEREQSGNLPRTKLSEKADELAGVSADIIQVLIAE